MNTDKVTRVEVIDHFHEDGGRVYSFWEKGVEGKVYMLKEKGVDVTLDLQDNERTLKIFITKKL